MPRLSEMQAFRRFNSSVFFHFIGRGLYNTFLPIILLENNYSLFWVFAFLFFSSLVTIVTSYWAQAAFSHRRILLLNIIAIFAEIALLLLLSIHQFSFTAFLFLLLFEGFYFTFYYLSYFSIINHFSRTHTVGSHLGNVSLVLTLSGAIAPFLGALLLNTERLLLLFVSVCFLFLSLLPLLRLNAIDINGARARPLPFRAFRREFFEYSMFCAFELVVFVLWIIYIHRLHISLLVISSVPIAAALSRMLLSQLVKKRLHTPGMRRRFSSIAVAGMLLVSLLRFFFPYYALLGNILMGVFFLLLQLSVETALFQAAKGYRTYQTSAAMSMITFGGRVFLLPIAFLLGLRWSILLPFAFGIPYLVFLAMHVNKKERREASLAP